MEILLFVVRILQAITADNLNEAASGIISLLDSTVAESLRSTDRKQHAMDLNVLARIGEVLLSPGLSTDLVRQGLVLDRRLGEKIGEKMGDISQHMERAVRAGDFNLFQDEEEELLGIIERLAWMMGKLGIKGYEEVCGCFSLWPDDLDSDEEEDELEGEIGDGGE